MTGPRKLALVVLVFVCLACIACGGGASEPESARASNQAGDEAPAPAAREGAGEEAAGLTLGQDPVPREQFAMGVAMISARRLCGTQRMCFVDMTPERCVRELGDAVLAYAIEGADLPDPVSAERQVSFVDRELQPLAMLVFAQHAESGERECTAADVIERPVVVRPEGCVRLESDPTPCGR
ncbi:MAG: hypothetical protein M3Y87_20460 [Myxococcota bacterium]|nr:hypothetical protein [Myxococcota bacterium]